MLLPLTILVRESANSEPEERTIAINPDTVARAEDGIDEGTIHVWADGTSKPYVIRGTVEAFACYVNGALFGDTEETEEEVCEPADSDTA